MNQQKPFLSYGLPNDKTPITLESLSANYTQNADGNSTEIQVLEVSTSDAGGGIYFVIKTERWAFDSIEELITLLTDFKNRVSA